ncbi:MAG: hypothetical protein K8R87_09275 [Verrucomicrobia bacterium]|nr:hypothetical protein [Verrucomicrobiota bacterium]
MCPADQPSNERTRQAAKIQENPQDYKVCEGCGSIVTSRTTACPSCHAYQFDLAEQRVIKQARALARRNANSVLSSDLA